MKNVRSDETVAVATGNLPLDNTFTVLVKYNFTNPKFIPAGVPVVERLPDQQIDLKHKLDAVRQRLGRAIMETGRYREDRVDTGEPVLSLDVPTRTSGLHEIITSSGFGLKQVHCLKRARQGHTTKFIVVAEYELGHESEVPEAVTDAVVGLGRDANWFCHIWQNRDPIDTINMVGRQPDSDPVYELALKDGGIVANPLI